MKHLPLLLAVAALLSPSAVSADADSVRHLRYALTARIGADIRQASIDVDFGRWTATHGMHLVIDERVRGDDLGALRVTIEPSGAILGATDDLTFEEETVLGMLGLQFENMTGVDRGDAWDRSGDLATGTQMTHFAVERSGTLVDLDVTRTIAFTDGTSGFWRGAVRYNAANVVPTSIAISGEVAQRAVALRAELTDDTFGR